MRGFCKAENARSCKAIQQYISIASTCSYAMLAIALLVQLTPTPEESLYPYHSPATHIATQCKVSHLAAYIIFSVYDGLRDLLYT